MGTFSVTAWIGAPVSRVWEVLADIAAISDWNPGVRSSRLESAESAGIGARRFCDLGGNDYLSEEVVTWEIGKRLTMRIVGTNLPFQTADIRFFLQPEGEGTMVTVSPEYALKFGILGELLDRMYVRRTYSQGMKALLRGLKEHVEGLHTYGGMAGRDMEALAIGIAESVDDDHVRSRVGQVRYLGGLLTQWDIPIVQPVGGHAIFLDAKGFYPHIPQKDFPAQTLTAQLYLDAGVRGMERGIVSAGRDPESGDHRYPSLELTRLAIPRRVYTQAHMDVVAEAIKSVFEPLRG